MKQFILILDGMTGSGKSTTAAFLSKHLSRTAIVGMDRIKWSLSDFERGQRDNTIARDVVFAMAKTYMNHGISLIVDQSLKTDELERYTSLAEEYWALCHKFQFYASPELAFKRVLERQKDRDNKVPEDRILNNISLFQSRESLGFFLIDTSELGIEDAGRIILERISAL